MQLVNKPELLWYVILYGIFVFVASVVLAKRNKTGEDFVLAGKSLGPAVLMGTLISTWCGSGTITGGPNSIAYSFGLWPALMFAIPNLLGIGIMYFIAQKIRDYGKFTIAEVLEIKYGSGARLLCGIIIILAYVGIVSYQFKGLGFILNVTTGISVELGTIVGAALIIFSAAVGGLVTVATVDALSAVIMLVGIILTVPAVISVAGGWSNIVANVPAQHLSLMGTLKPIQILGFYLPMLFLLLGDQNMYQRLAASKGNREARIGILGWLVGLCIIAPAVPLISFAARSMFPKIPAGMALISTSLVVPQVLGGLLLAAAAAFIVTTGNSYVLSAATNVAYDIFGKFIKPNATDKERLVLVKIMIPVLGLISYVMIMYFPSILAVQMYSYTVYGAGITPAVLGVLLWKKVTKAGGLASMLSGVLITLFWEIIMKNPNGINSSVISIPTAIVVLIVVSLLTQPSKTNVDN